MHYKQCKGTKCTALNGMYHSIECEKQHDSFVHRNAGNRHPGCRYAGYDNKPIGVKNATADQQAAWLEGCNAREPRGK